jgi:parallel beta-helix repeat protein
MYLNGNSVDTNTFYGDRQYGTLPVQIGRYNNGWWQYTPDTFNGLIDEVRIWNIARTQEDIQKNMNQPIENPELLENLVGYWNFDSGTADDLSQYGNDGTLQGDAAIANVISVPDDYPTIQLGINAANPGDMVVVDPGTYYENITISKDGIMLQGSGAGVTTIDGGGIGSVVKITGSGDVIISGFTITNGLGNGEDYYGSDNGGGIAVYNCSNITIENNLITQNHATKSGHSDGGGIMICKCTGNVAITKNSITDNHARHWGGGISIQGTFDVRIDGNDISNNTAGLGGGISFWEGDPAEGASAWIINNRIASNQGDGIYISDGCSAVIGGNLQNSNDIFGNTSYAVRNDSTNTIDATYNFWGTTVEIEIRAAIWDYYDDGSKGVVNYKPWIDREHRRIFPFAQAFSLDGNEDWAEIPNHPSINFTQDANFTIEGWFLTTQNSSPFGDTSLLEKWGGPSGYPGYPYVIRLITSSGQLVFRVYDGSKNPSVFSTIPVNDGKWHHFACIKQGTSFMEIYIDGRLEERNTDVITGNIQNDSPLFIGRRGGPTMPNFFDGLIDEVRIWNVVLTQEQIQDAMNRTLIDDEIKSENLVGYWRFDDGTANDSSLYGNHGTLMGDAEIVPLYGTWPPPKIGDVSGNGTVSAYDAALILQYVVGLIDEFPAERMSSPSVIEPHDYEISLPDVETPASGKIQVPIVINDATGLLAGGITIKYDPTVLRAVNYASLKLLNGYYWKANTNLPGEVRFAFATTEAATMGQGNLLMVEFEVLPNAEGKTSPLILENVNLSNSLSIKKINGEVRVIPSSFALLQNFPNPFNPDTWLPYKLASDSSVSINIYNVKGQLIRTLHLGYQNAGVYVTRDKAAYWDGRDDAGERVSSGVYFYTLRVERQRNPNGGGVGEFRTTRKMVIVK